MLETESLHGKPIQTVMTNMELSKVDQENTYSIQDMELSYYIRTSELAFQNQLLISFFNLVLHRLGTLLHVE